MPASIVLDLPFPPSVNRVWRAVTTSAGKRTLTRSAEYLAWINAADRLVWANVRLHDMAIAGPFRARITLDRNRRRIDLDNAIKCILDYAQRLRVIGNDKHCESILAEWGASCDAPHGCRLELTAIAARDAAE